MFRIYLLVIIYFFTVFILPSECKYGSNYQKFNNYPNAEKADYDGTPKSSRGLGISAWGIIFLVVTLILVSVGAYYMAIFYPLLCKKERKYDRIELATV